MNKVVDDDHDDDNDDNDMTMKMRMMMSTMTKMHIFNNIRIYLLSFHFLMSFTGTLLPDQYSLQLQQQQQQQQHNHVICGLFSRDQCLWPNGPQAS